MLDPSTEKVIGSAVAASQEDVDIAVESARKAFDTTWSQTDAHEKGRILYKLADLIEKNAEWLAYYETLNNGKPISVSQNEDIPFTAYIERYFRTRRQDQRKHFTTDATSLWDDNQRAN